jgi:hypothetical protein
MPRKPKAAKKSYAPPSFSGLVPNKAKAVLEARTVPGDLGAPVILRSISNSKAAPRSKMPSESVLQPLK